MESAEEAGEGMKYEQKSFSIGSSAASRRNWDAVFGIGELLVAGVKQAVEMKERRCLSSHEGHSCYLDRSHKGAHRCYECNEVQWINGEYL